MEKKSKEKKEVCEICGEEIKSKEGNHEHKEDKKDKERSLVCEFC
jgi:hypothetical protein